MLRHAAGVLAGDLEGEMRYEYAWVWMSGAISVFAFEDFGKGDSAWGLVGSILAIVNFAAIVFWPAIWRSER